LVRAAAAAIARRILGGFFRSRCCFFYFDCPGAAIVVAIQEDCCVRAAAAAITRRKLRFGMYSTHHLLRYMRSEVLLIEWLIFGLGNVLSFPREIVQLLTDAPGARRVCTDLAGL